MKHVMKFVGMCLVAIGLVLLHRNNVGVGSGLAACGLYWMTYDWEDIR